MGKLILVTGGARSGKSSFAEKYATIHGRKIAYVATAEIRDEEMRYRIDLHKQRRPETWKTYEAPLDPNQAIRQAAADGNDLILFDCLTLYLSNLLCQPDLPADLQQQHDHIQGKITELIRSIKACNSTVVIVTNEVGAGIVPENALARQYRDLSGLANQAIAREAADVYLVACGLPLNIKKLAQHLEA
ncbi:MAG: bifunctional adenosylcobinamide kinase/adenosylcobinamide-phosphate guanylyltransferase [Selenomonadaceae bacterium]